MEFEADVDHDRDDEHLALGDDPDGRRPRHLSPSSSAMYRQCPRKWRHRYLDRLADPPGEPALVGTFAHLVLERLLQLPEGQRSQDAARTLARTHWPETEAAADYRALGLSEAGARAFRWRAWEAIAGLWALEDPDNTHVHATEHEVQVELAGVPFRGIVDRVDVVDDALVISDYKSGRAPAERFRDRPLRQVLLYAAAVEADFGRRPDAARLLYLGQRTVGVAVTPQNLGTVLDELSTTWASVTNDCDSGDFAASPGPLCAWCPFLAVCPEGRHEVHERHQAGTVRADAPGLAVIYAEAG